MNRRKQETKWSKRAYRNFLKEYQRLQAERIAAFQEFAADVKSGRFPAPENLVAMEETALKAAIEAINSDLQRTD